MLLDTPAWPNSLYSRNVPKEPWELVGEVRDSLLPQLPPDVADFVNVYEDAGEETLYLTVVLDEAATWH